MVTRITQRFVAQAAAVTGVSLYAGAMLHHHIPHPGAKPNKRNRRPTLANLDPRDPFRQEFEAWQTKRRNRKTLIKAMVKHYNQQQRDDSMLSTFLNEISYPPPDTSSDRGKDKADDDASLWHVRPEDIVSKVITFLDHHPLPTDLDTNLDANDSLLDRCLTYLDARQQQQEANMQQRLQHALDLHQNPPSTPTTTTTTTSA